MGGSWSSAPLESPRMLQSDAVRKELQRVKRLEEELARTRAYLAQQEEALREVREKSEADQQSLVMGACAVVGLTAVGAGMLVARTRARATTALAAAANKADLLLQKNKLTQAMYMKASTALTKQEAEASKYGYQKFAKAMLETGDDLRRALDHIPEAALRENKDIATLHSGIHMAATSFERCVFAWSRRQALVPCTWLTGRSVG
jgi:molecular chaperone GrpE (heat shock protein)